MAKKLPNTKKATKKPSQKPAKRSTPKPPTNKARMNPVGGPIHLLGLEVLAQMALNATPQVKRAGVEDLAAADAGNNMSPAKAVMYALNKAVGLPLGPNDSVSGLGVASNVQWEGLANDLHKARNSYTLNGTETRARLPAAPGDTVSALVGVVKTNS